jgi:hypothetical protein
MHRSVPSADSIRLLGRRVRYATPYGRGHGRIIWEEMRVDTDVVDTDVKERASARCDRLKERSGGATVAPPDQDEPGKTVMCGRPAGLWLQHDCGYSTPSSMRTTAPFGCAPTIDWTGLPSLNTVSVGTDITS